MTTIRKPGKINDDTTLIDTNMMGIPGILSIYLIEAGKSCLIDAGTHIEARKTLKQLKELNKFPPDMIIATHSHWDHVQAIPFLCQRAKKEGKEIEILASVAAIPNLRDQSYNDIFETGPFNNIEEEITPLKEGDIVDLDGITLKIFEAHGHMNDEIAILDEKNNNLFVGDVLGMKVADEVFVPPFMPPKWDQKAYLKTVDKFKKIEYDALCLNHFGYYYGNEAKSILDESLANTDRFWRDFEANIDQIEDIPYLIAKVLKKRIPEPIIDQYPERLVEAVVYWLSLGFKIYKGL